MAPSSKSVGHYQLVSRLSASPTSEVHLASAYGEPFAVKLLKPEHLKESFYEILEREQAVAMTFSHPVAVKVLEVTEEARQPVIAMELAWGQPLGSLVRRAAGEGRPLDRDLVQWIGLQIAELLLHAHRTPWAAKETAGLLHGRLAPADILITYSGHVKVPGFGLGRSSLTLPLSPAKIPYRAPELFRNVVDTRSDVYALGVNLYDAFTGQTLFKRSNNDETREAILAGGVTPLHREVPSVSRELSMLVAKMLSTNLDARPALPDIIQTLRSGLPSGDACRLAVSERMFQHFGNEQRAHQRLRSQAFPDLGPDPYLERGVPAPAPAPVAPPKLDPSALVEIHSGPASSYGAVAAAPKPYGAVAPAPKSAGAPKIARGRPVPEDSTDLLLDGFYEAMDEQMSKPSLPPDEPEDEPATVLRPALTAPTRPTPPASPTPPRAAPAAERPRAQARSSGSQDLPVATPKRKAPAPEPPPSGGGKDVEIGDEIAGRYKVLDFIGEGGMARVFKVQHTLLEKDMALKVLRPEVMEVQGVVERFEREARASCKLDDPNIVRVTDFGRTEHGLPFLVMELLTGSSLSAHLKERGRFEPDEAFAIIEGVLSGLEHAHSFDIVHRDMKPDNIVLVERGERRTAKIVDFGIAQVMKNESDPSRKLTQVGMVFGTPAYMSPEQATAEPMDLRTDLYAVGVILYEMLAGVSPFRAESTVKLLTKVITQPPPPLPGEHLPDTLRARLERVIFKALEKSKEDRFSSAAEFRSALRQAIGRTR